VRKRGLVVAGRLFVILCCAGMLLLGAALTGTHIAWVHAVVGGLGVGLTGFWPLTLSRSGIGISLLSGLYVALAMLYGLPTALMALLIEAALRVLAESGRNLGRHWSEWTRILGWVTVMVVTWGVAHLCSMVAPAWADGVAAVIFWLGRSFLWWLRKGRGTIHQVARYRDVLRETLWVPVIMYVLIELVHLSGSYYHLDHVLVGLIVLIHATAGRILSQRALDRAVIRLLRQIGARPTELRKALQQALHLAHSLSGLLGLPAWERRAIDYAALLQGLPSKNGGSLPLWFPEGIPAEERGAVGTLVHGYSDWVEQAGLLQEVGEVLRFRYASYDGSGLPAVAGDAIPLRAQVLAAANALVVLTGERHLTLPEAVSWLVSRAANRFAPAVLGALQKLSSSAPPEAEDIPSVVRQLQSYMGDEEEALLSGLTLRDLLRRLQIVLGLGKDLPEEMAAIARLSRYFASATDPGQTANRVVEAVGRLTRAKVLLWQVCADEGLSVRVQAAWGMERLDLQGQQEPLVGGRLTQALLEGEPHQVPDILEIGIPFFDRLYEAEGIRSVLVVPLVARGRSTGLLMIGTRHFHWFSPREVSLIHLMADQAAVALENARLLAETEERLQHLAAMKAFQDTLLDNLQTGIVSYDKEGYPTRVNQAAFRLLESDDPLERAMVEQRRLPSWTKVFRSVQGEVTEPYDINWGGKVLEVQAAPMHRADEGVIGAVMILRDVTRDRAMAKQVQQFEKLAAVGQLAAGAAHEIRNPLTAIRGFIQLEQRRRGEQGKETWALILEEIDRIDEIIQTMLLLARPADLKRTPTDLSGLLDEVLLVIQPHLTTHAVQIERQVAPNLPSIRGDRAMLKQLIYNLVINAVQAMPDGGRLTVGLSAQSDQHLCLTVQDTGVGIRPEHRSRLFEPFFTTKEKGTGLGLALCYSVVQAHGGEITVDSAPGVGTRFTVLLPRNREDEWTTTAQASAY
jgi:signal transduction histidine kinase